MSRLYTQSEATAARRRFPIFLVDATDGLTPETAEAAGQPQISQVGGAWANTSATLTAIGNGAYYVELTAAELATLGMFQIRYKSAATAEFNMDGQVILHDLFTSVTQTGDSFARIGASGISLSAIPDLAGVTTLLARIIGTLATGTHVAQTGDSFVRLGPPAGASVSADVAAVQADTDNMQTRLPTALVSGRIDASVGAMAADVVTAAAIATDAIGSAEFSQAAADKVWSSTTRTLTAISTALALGVWDVLESAVLTASSMGLKVKNNLDVVLSTRATPAQVNTEVLDVLNVDTFAEPGQEDPPATTTLVKKIGYLYKFLRNKIVQSSTTAEVYNDAGTVVDHKSTVSDTGLVTTRGKFVTGP